MNLINLAEDYIHFLKYERRMSLHTIESYLSDIKQFLEYLKEVYAIENVHDVSWMHIRSYIVEISFESYKASSLQRKQSAIKQFFDFAVLQKIIKKNPVKRFPKRRVEERLPEVLTEKQTEMLFSEEHLNNLNISLRDRIILEILYQTGMRVTELIEMKERNIDFSKCELKILGKGNKWRIIPIHKDLSALLKEYKNYKAEENLIVSENFLTLESGAPLYRQYVYRVVKKYLSSVSSASYKGPHVLRHTFASQLLNAGANLIHIKELLGHESLESTQIYTKVHIERLKEVYKKAHPKNK